MFTGIVEEIGSIKDIKKGRFSSELSIFANDVLIGTKIGDSISVNGVCLTVTQIYKNYFTSDVMHETLNRSNLKELKNLSVVNLERAVLSDKRLGGHIVSGHVDGIGRIINIYRDDNAIWYRISADKKILKYIVEKGSVTLDGISLTVADVNITDFSVCAIPHTIKNTVLQYKKIGDLINIENDIIGKYIEKFLSFENTEKKSVITEEFLRVNGF